MKTYSKAILIATVALASTTVSARPGDRVDRYPLRVCQSCVGTDLAPAVAADATGNFVVAWRKHDTDDENGVWARRYAANGTPLGGEFRVSPQGTTLSSAVAVAMAPDGRFVVAWDQTDRPDGDAIVARRFAANGSALTGVLTVSPPGVWPAVPRAPDVAMDSAGNFVIVWRTYVPDRKLTRGFGRSYDSSGAPRGAQFFIADAGSAGSFVQPEVAMGDQGQVVVVWFQQVDPDPTSTDDIIRRSVRGKRFDLLGNPVGTAFPVASSNVGELGDIDLAADSTGAFAVAYPRWRNTPEGSESTGVFVRRFTAHAVALGGEMRVSGPGSTSSAGGVDVDVDDDGDFAVVWIGQTTFGVLTELHVRLYTDGGVALMRDRAFKPFENWGPSEATVSMDANGDFVVAFQNISLQPDNISEFSDNVFAQRFAGPDDRRASCAGIIARIVGTSGNDTIHGTPGDDVINGFGGDDLVYGGGGSDALCGAAGQDQLFGEAGEDFLFGGGGDDVLDGGSEHDVCVGNAQVNADTAIQCEQVTGVP